MQLIGVPAELQETIDGSQIDQFAQNKPAKSPTLHKGTTRNNSSTYVEESRSPRVMRTSRRYA